MGGIPSELRIVINTMAAKALAELHRVEAMLLRIRRSGLDKPIVRHSVHGSAFTELSTLQKQLVGMRTSNANRPPPVMSAVHPKAFVELNALDAKLKATRATAATTGAALGGSTAAMAGGAAAAATSMAATSSAIQNTGGIMGRFMAAQNSSLRAFGSEVQWTGRQMMHHLTLPFIMMGAFAGKTWFEQEDVMTQVIKVYGDAGQSASELSNEIDALRENATQLSEIYGRNREEVLQVAEAWAVAGASGRALSESMNLTMQASVLGSMDAVKASEMLIAVQAQYGVDTEGLTKILAQLNYAGNNTALTIEELGDGFQRSAAIARTSGMSAAHLAGMIASIAPAAGTAKQAGNGLRMIMTRVQSQTSDTTRVIEYMNESLGDGFISMNDFYGLPMEKKLMHLADGYDKLGGAQRAQAASMIGGTYQVGRLDVLLRELKNSQGYYNKIVDDLQDDTKVATVMFQELTKNLTSDPRKIQQAWQKFRNAMAEAFVPLIPIVTHFMNTIGELVKSFSRMDPALQKLVVAIAMAFAMLGPIIILMGVFALTAAQLPPIFFGIGGAIYWLTLGPFVALIKGAYRVIGALFATGTATEALSPKLKAVNRVGTAVAGSMAKNFGALFSRMKTWYIGQDLFGLNKLGGKLSGHMVGIVGRFKTWYAALTAQSFAAGVVDRVVQAKNWAVKLAMDASGSAKQLATRATTETSLIAMGNSGWAARIAQRLRGWAAILTLDRASGATILAQQGSTEAASHAMAARAWGVRHVINATNWVQQVTQHAMHRARLLAIDAGNYAHRQALALGFWGTSNGITAAGASRETAIEAAKWMKLRALTIAGWAGKLAVALMGANALAFLQLRHEAVMLAIQRAGGIKQLAFTKVMAAKNLLFTAAGWKKIIAVTLTSVGNITKAVRGLALFSNPIGIAVAAGIAFFALFGDRISDIVDAVKGYFQKLPADVAQGLQPIVKLWNGVISGITGAWNKLPGVIQKPLIAVWNMISKAMQGIRKLLSFMNPFQRHSPSLVDNVNAGMNVIGSKFNSTANSVQGSVAAMGASIAGLRGSFAELDAMNASNKRSEDIGTIQSAGVGDVGAQIAAYENVEGQITRLKASLGGLNQQIGQQEAVVNRAAAAVERAEGNIKTMNVALDQMKERADSAGAALEVARGRLDHFSSATISGMGAVDDAMFGNEMAQKKLQLQIAKLEETAGVATGGASNHFAKLQGDIETLSGKRMELHFSGAGSDITDVYKGMENDLKGQQLQIGSPDIPSGPAAEISKLQAALDELDSKANIMDLEKSLKFDPLTRQIESMTNASNEMSFESIVSGIRSSSSEIKSLEGAYEAATAAVQGQEAAIAQAEAARDILSARHSEQDEALKALRDSYSSVEDSIRDGESALGDMTTAAEEAIRRVEELQRANESAANAARSAADKANKSGAGGKGGKGSGGGGIGGGGIGGGGIGEEGTSPRFGSFLAAESADDFGDPGMGFTVGRDFDLGTDQSQAMADFDPLAGMPELDDLMGEFDMLSPIKDAWQKVVDWWNGVVTPLGDPLGLMFGDVGDVVSDVFGGETLGIIEFFKDTWEQLVTIWDNVLWPVLVKIGEFIGNTLRPVLENLGNVFSDKLGPVLAQIGDQFADLWPHIKVLFAALWDIGKWILGFLIAKVLLKFMIIATAVWAVLMVGINMISHMLVPVLDWLGSMIQGVILIFQGVVRIISGAINIIMGIIKTLWGVIVGIFTGDWSQALEGLSQLWQGVKDFVMGIVDIFLGLGLMIWTTIKNAFHLVYKTIWGFIEGIIDFFYGLYETIVGNSIIPDMVNDIVSWIASLPGKVFGFISNLVVTVVKFFWDLYVGVVTWVADLVVTVVKFFWDLYVDAVKWIADLVMGIVGWFAELPGKVWDKITDLKDRVVSGFFIIKDRVTETVGNIIAAVIDWFKELPGRIWDAVMEAKRRTIQAFNIIKDKILDVFGNAKDWLFDTGKDLIQGLVDGVRGMGDVIKKAIVKLVPEKIRGPIERALGIESPSKVFMGIGENIVEGMIVGLESKSGDLESSIKAVADISKSVEIAGPSVAPTVDVPTIPDMPTVTMPDVDIPAMQALPTFDTPQVPDMSVPEMPEFVMPEMPEFEGMDLSELDWSATADEEYNLMLAGFTAFDTQYQLLVQQHTMAVTAQYSLMYLNLGTQFQVWSAAMLVGYTNLTIAMLAQVASYTSQATSMFESFYMNLTTMTTTALANISSLLVGNSNSWLSVIASFISALLTAWTNMINQLIALLQGGANNLTSIWQRLGDDFNSIFQNSIKPVFDAFLPMLETLEGWFRSTVDNVGEIWGEVKPKTAEPARFVIDEVYNTGLREAWGSFNEFLGIDPLPPYTAKFREGGPVWGAGTGTSDSIPALLSNNEHVITDREVRGAGGHGAIKAQRDLWRSGRSTYDQVHAFAEGGAVNGARRRLPGSQHITTPIQWAMHNSLASAFPGSTISSGTRYADVGAGYDNHMQGRALDIVGPMNQIARWIEKTHGRSALELIHAPEVGFRNLWHGKPHTYSGGTMSDHYDHVHWATNSMVGDDGKLIFAGGGSGEAGMIDWSEYIASAFTDSMKAISDKDPGFAGGIGKWVPKSIEKAKLAEDFLSEKAAAMTQFHGGVDDTSGMVERWRPMMKAALIKQGLGHWANDKAILDRFMRQIQTESGGVPNITQGIQDINSGGNEAEGLAQIAKSTWPAYRDPSLVDDWHDPWASLNTMARYVHRKYGEQGYMRIGNGIGYDEGGIMPQTPGGYGTFYNHTDSPEAVLTKPQWDNIYRAADSAISLSYEDIVRAFKGGFGSSDFENALENGVVKKIDPRWKEIELAVFDAAELIAISSDENIETWVDAFTKTGEDAKDFFSSASEFYNSTKETLDFFASDEFWDKVKENSGEGYGKAEEALDHLNHLFSGFSFIEERELLAAEVGGAVDAAGGATVKAIDDADMSEDEREEERKKREDEAAASSKTEKERAEAREYSLFNRLGGLFDQRLAEVSESIGRIGSADIFSLQETVEREMGHLTGIANETFGSIENAGSIAGHMGDALHKLVFQNFNLTGAIEDIRAAAGPDGQIPLILQAVVDTLDKPDNRDMVLQLEEYGRVVVQAIGKTLSELDFGKYYAPIIEKLADWIDNFPRYEAQYAKDTTTGFANSMDSIITRPLETALNFLGGIYNTFLDLAPSLLRHASTIGGTLSSFAASGTGALGAIMVAVTTGNPLGLIPHIPQLLAVGLELIPQIIDAIINIVPLLLQSLMDLFLNFMPWSNQGHATAEDAFEASVRVSKKIDDNTKLFFGDTGGKGDGSDTSTWRPEGASGNQNNFYGDLSFPNVKGEDDAKGFIENLSRL